MSHLATGAMLDAFSNFDFGVSIETCSRQIISPLPSAKACSQFEVSIFYTRRERRTQFPAKSSLFRKPTVSKTDRSAFVNAKVNAKQAEQKLVPQELRKSNTLQSRFSRASSISKSIP